MSGYIYKPADSQIYTVSKMIRSGMNSGYGTPCDYVGLRAALRAGRRWIERGEDFYFTIERKMEPFAEGRGDRPCAPDFLCMTGGHDNFLTSGVPLDAPEWIAAGSLYRSFGSGEQWPKINRRGCWI